MHAAEQRPGDGDSDRSARQRQQQRLGNHRDGYGQATKTNARNVPISWVRAATAEYMVLSEPNRAPSAMIPPIV